MKFLVATVAIFASSTLAAKYAAGDPCHTNVECEENCLDKRYTVAEQDGGFVFVCDPSAADPMQWYIAECTGLNVGGGLFPDYRLDQETTEANCKATSGGQTCNRRCLLKGKRTDDEDTRSAWAAGCGQGKKVVITVKPDEQAAKAYC
jgi:hypothetical protein